MDTSPRTMLIVDTPDAGVEILRILQADSAAYECTLVATSEAARAMYRKTLPDVIVLSARLPDADGLALLDELTREHSPLAFATIVLLEAADQALVPRARALGAYTCLFKTGDLSLYLAQSAADAFAHLDLQRERAALQREVGLQSQHTNDTQTRDNQQRLAALVDLLPIGIAVLDSHGQVVYANTAFASALRLSREQVLAGEYDRHSYIQPGGLPMPRSAFASTRARAEQRLVQNVETGIVDAEGHVTWVNVSAMPLTSADWSMVLTVDDLTERNQAAHTLFEAQQRLQLALQAANMGTFVWHFAEDQAEMDERMRDLFGLPAGGTLSLATALASVLHPDDRARYAAAVAHASTPAGGGVLREEVRIIHPD
ncbi:MAG TPA: PAS domain-containing protein, partial [Roseiflexaceae bacterium]|nr:PAS domain-containing protein [Roseiflexaceae bacterium]